PYTIGFNQTGNAIYKRLQVQDADLQASQNPGATYFGECQYVTQDDATASNQNNNASYRRVTVTANGSNFTLNPTATTQRMRWSIHAWRDTDPSVTLTSIDNSGDGRIWVAYQVTNTAPGVWHYEYAIENLNSDRSVGSVSIPVLGAAISNVGYHDVKHHS